MEHHQSSQAPESSKPMSPQTTYSSESENRASSSQAPTKKRASRAGTRSVSALTAAQLERKRANDREAQRAIRQRTKEHIENLERRIQELTNEETGAKLIQALQRNSELEQEIAILRSQLSQNVGMNRESAMLSARSPPTNLAMHSQPQIATTPTQSVAGIVAASPQQEHWQHQSHSSVASATSGAPTAQGPSDWTQHQSHSLPHPGGQQEGGQHVAPPGQSSYGYSMPYQGSSQVNMPYEQQQATSSSNPYQQMNYPRTMPQDVQQPPATAYSDYQGHQSYVQHQQQMPHSPSGQHMYNIPPNMKPRQ